MEASKVPGTPRATPHVAGSHNVTAVNSRASKKSQGTTVCFLRGVAPCIKWLLGFRNRRLHTWGAPLEEQRNGPHANGDQSHGFRGGGGFLFLLV